MFLLVVLASVSVTTAQQAGTSAQAMFEAARKLEVVDGDLEGAIRQYQLVVDRFSGDRRVMADALVRMAEAFEKLGNAKAREIYQRLVRDFSDQGEAATVARAKLGTTKSVPVVRGDRAVWTGPKVDLFGRVSPDGRFVTYTDWNAYASLALHDLTTNTDRALVENKNWDDPSAGEASYSATSPDGTQVAFGWWRRDAREVRTVSTTAGASPPRTLLRFSPDEVRFVGVRSWSPDGKLLAVGTTRFDGTTQIIIATVTDGGMRVLSSHAWRGADALYFSHDSKYLAFDLPADPEADQHDIYVLAVDGSGGGRLIENAADDRIVGWSPDDRYLVFASDRSGSLSVWGAPFSNGRLSGIPTVLKADVGRIYSLGISNGGTLYAYKQISDADVKVAPIDVSAGRLTGPPVHFLQGMLSRPMAPHWSPDGKYLAYQTRGENGIAIRTVSTGQVRRLPRKLEYATDPRWSPDGSALIAAGRDSRGRDGIYRIDVTSGDVTTVMYSTTLGTIPRWSRDGASIYYRTDDAIRERALSTGAERDVYRGLSSDFEVSPDGRYLSVRTRPDPSSKTASLLLVPVAGGGMRELDRLNQSQLVELRALMTWTPDSRHVLTARRATSGFELRLVDVERAEARTLDIDVREWTLSNNGDGLNSGFSLSPDGRSIAFIMGKSSAEVWAIENFLPASKSSRR
jgi:Tol biopolymer transport system component